MQSFISLLSKFSLQLNITALCVTFTERFLVVVLFAFIYVSCGESKIQSHSISEALPIDTITFLRPPGSDILLSDNYLHVSDSAVVLIASDVSEQFIYLIAQNGSRIHRIDVFKALGRSAQEMTDVMVNGFYVQSLDSIFILLNPSNELALIDSSGNLQKIWSITSQRDNGVYRNLYSYFRIAPLHYSNGTITTCQQSWQYDHETNVKHRKEYFSLHSDVSIRLEEDTSYIVAETGRFPAEYRQHYWYDDMKSRAVSASGQFVYSFGVNDSLYVYEKGVFTKGVFAKSAFMKEPKPFDANREADMGYLQQYWVEESRYYAILYDHYNHCYYRIVLHGLPYRESDGSLNTVFDVPWSIIMLDQSLNTIAEYQMPARQYNFLSVIPSPWGLMVSMEHDLNPTKEEGFMKYAVFDFKTPQNEN